MERADFQRFRAVMAGMGKVFERETDQVVLDAYWLTLHDWPIDDFEAAAAELLRTNTFMPRPAEFTELRRKARRRTAAEAWFTRGVSEDPRANRAMRVATQGRYIGHVPVDELPFVQRRFVEVYDELQDVEESRAALSGPPDWLQLTAKTAGALKGPGR